MSTLRLIIAALVVCLVAGAVCADDTEAVNSVLDNIERAHRAHDTGLLGEQYSKELLVVGESPTSDQGAFLLDKDRILAATREQTWKSAGLETRTLTGRNIVVRNDLAYVRATVVDTFTGGKSSASEQYLICTKKGSRWQVCCAMPRLVTAKVRVTNVQPGSAADRAQIRSGDIVAARNGEEIDPLLIGTQASDVFGPRSGAQISLLLRRSGSETRIQTASGLEGAAVEAILAPTGTAKYVPADQPHPVRDILKSEIAMIRTGDAQGYRKILTSLGFFSFRREAGKATQLVTVQNALTMLGRQLEDSRQALKPSSVELTKTDVIATENIALAAGTVHAVDRSGAKIDVQTRLHLYVRKNNEWCLAADLVDRFQLAPEAEGAVVLSADETRKSDRTVKGTMVGIGAKLSQSSTGIVIEGVIAGAPAERAGLTSGDVITSVDGHLTKGESVAQVVQRIAGEEGTSVALEIQGVSGDKRTISVTRAIVKLTGVDAKVLPDGIGHLMCTTFNQETPAAIKEALTKTFAGGSTKGFIFDLRGNSGGLLPAVTSVAELMIDGDPPTVLWIGRRKGSEAVLVQAKSSAVSSVPCVALIDEKTSGGAELLAEALRQHRRATLVGRKTAGAAVMKERTTNPDGTSNIVEVGDFLFPQTGKTGKEGVVPDVIATGDAKSDQLLELAKKTLLKLTGK